MEDRRLRMLTSFVAGFRGADVDTEVGLRARLLVRPREDLANRYLNEQGRPSSPRPASVYRERLATDWTGCFAGRLWCDFPGRRGPQRCREGKAQKQLKCED